MKIDLRKLKQVHRCSSNHRDEVLASPVCGCFYCEKLFPPSLIERWIHDEQTAICPHCGIDSVLGSLNGVPPAPELLKAMRKRYFDDTVG